MNKLLSILLLGSILIGCSTKVESRFVENYENPYRFTCLISTDEGSGTGVLLDSGIIITAGHVLDNNNNGKLDEDELECQIEFFYPVAAIHTGLVVFIGDYFEEDNLDIGLVQIPRDIGIKSTISILSPEEYSAIKYGESVFTIGCPLGNKPKLSTGVIETPSRDILGRATCTTIMGNSGGGLFTKEGRLAGIVVQSHSYNTYSPWTMVIPIPTSEGPVIASGSGSYTQVHFSPNWTEFITAPEIVKLLTENNLSSSIKSPTPELNLYKVYFALFFNMILLAILIRTVNEFRKRILG